MPRLSAEIEIDVVCNVCGEELFVAEVKDSRHVSDTICTLYVKQCECCCIEEKD